MRIKLAYSSTCLFLYQRKYVLDLLKETKKISYRPIRSSIDCGTFFSSINGDLVTHVAKF